MARPMLRVPLNEPADVVVIGTGAGGGNVIRELCLKGVKVVALEAGPRLDPDRDFEEDEWVMFHKLSWLDPVIGEGPDMTGLPAWICQAVGGTTTHWAGAALRFQPHEFQARSTYGEIPGADLDDWPLDLDSLAPFYEEAERALGVAGRVLPLPPGNTNFLVMQRGAEKTGWHAKPGFMAINTEEYDGRAACTQRGYCFQGCRNQAKWSSLYEAIPKAEATGLLDLRPNCQALHINVDSQNRVTSVVYARADGQWEEQKARAVVIAGNAIQTPRLLLQSVSGKYPHGLANGSGMVGRYYMRHVTASSYALFPRPIHAYKGMTMMGLVDDFANNDPEVRHFVGGFHLETIMLGPSFASVFIEPGPGTSTPNRRALWGKPLVELMENYTRLAGLWIVGEDMPQAGNRVTLHPYQKDQYGMPVPVVTYHDHPNDRAMREYAWSRARELYLAAGATKVYDTPPYPATHNLGTCRMGHDPSASVVNEFGQAHEVKNLFIADGSIFTTSAAENPTLTISALAIRQAHYLVDLMMREEL